MSDEVPNPANIIANALKTKVSNLEDELTKNKSELDNLRTELTTVKQDLEAKTEEVSSYQSKYENLNKEFDTSKSELNQYKQDFDNSKKDMESKNLEISKLNSNLEAKSSELQQTQNRLEMLQTELTTLKEKTSGSANVQQEVKVLKALLNAESSAYQIYEVLQSQTSIDMRKLAMQSGLSTAQIKKFIESLEKAGLVKVERAGMDDPNPKISLRT